MFVHFSLQKALLKYNASNAKKWDFTALSSYCSKVSNNPPLISSSSLSLLLIKHGALYSQVSETFR